MTKLTQTFDSRKAPQNNPKPASITHDAENRCDNAALSDNDLELVSSAGVTSVPTMHPETLLGRHARPSDTETHKP